MSFTPPYRVIAGRGIVDAHNRVVAHAQARRSVDADGYVTTMSENAPILPGLSPEAADQLAHTIAQVLTVHNGLVSALNRIADRAPIEEPSEEYDDIESAHANGGHIADWEAANIARRALAAARAIAGAAVPPVPLTAQDALDQSALEVLIANLRKAVRHGKPANIGGGIFHKHELSFALRALDRLVKP